jgi:thymidylate kinase
VISLEAPSRPERASPEALGLLTALFARLHDEGVGYCHWKSNEHLQASMLGLTDLDLLIDQQSASKLPIVLEAAGFKRFQAKPGRGYPGIEDYVGFDVESGRLSHLHIHYQLTLGARFLKGHRLPWEGAVIAGRQLDLDSGVFVAAPEAEMLVLIARAALKIRWRDRLSRMLGKPYVKGGVLRELRWLAERIDVERLATLALPLVGSAAARCAQEIAKAEVPSLGMLSVFRNQCIPALDAYRIYSPLGGLMRQWVRELRSIGERATRRVWGGLRAAPRTAPRGGRVVALIGADGAGKSTLTREVATWLSRQTMVISVYGGSGAGSASAVRSILERLASLARSLLARPRKTDARSGGPTAVGTSVAAPLDSRLTPKTLWKALWVMSLARERRKSVQRAWRARTLGAVVLADRHPQTQFSGISDGPQLDAWRMKGPALLRFAAQKEHAAFVAMDRYPPDVVIKLLVSADVALERKPARSEVLLRRKVEIVRKLKYPPVTRVVEVNADLPLEHVLREVKRAVWDSL